MPGARRLVRMPLPGSDEPAQRRVAAVGAGQFGWIQRGRRVCGRRRRVAWLIAVARIGAGPSASPPPA